MFFKRKKPKQIEFTEYHPKEKKGTKNNGLLTTFDRMEYFIVQENSEEELFKICDTILGGRAVLANFDKLSDEDANEMLMFISGVIYATEGRTYKLDSRLFLFGRKEEYEDGSLLQYIEDTQ
ncbi:MAG: cell division protein SepF [Acholeplasmataceae bacterium]|nr:cell division protein SepF [Acholeplasmataceae bacterium]HPT89778.1 cell division protein SepF [Bacilli bacterium]HQA19590.1 cell division protein SepF [Bacilli bacterium]HQD92345.1 cell division protein SepF [Bacilli bacterium]